MKLNLGDGGLAIPGYSGLDIKRGESIYPLVQQFNARCDEVRASHVLEHFPKDQVVSVIEDWVACLKPGGWLKIAVPDLGKILTWWQEDRDNEHDLLGYLFGGQTDEYDYHKVAFDESLLAAVMQEAGLVDIQRWESEIKDCATLEVSLNLMGQKPDKSNIPDTAEVRKPKSGEICAVMTAPRLGFMENCMSWARALAPLGIEITKTGGVFWGQGLTLAFERRIESGAKYFLTMDYDSVFTKEDVLRLYDIMERRSDIDALCALQTRREMIEPLLTIPSEAMHAPGRVTFDYFREETAELRSAHFGLTLLRVDKLRNLSRPWFWAVPDEDGRWGEGRMDEDVAFWHKWRAEGNTIHLACRVPIGHVQAVVTFPSSDFTGRHQFIRDYEQNGKPDWIWK